MSQLIKNQIQIESVNKKCFNLYLSFILKTFLLLNIKVKMFCLPQKLKKITFLKSPHVFKKSKEHFELRKYKVFLNFNSKKEFLYFLILNKPSTIKIKINLKKGR